MFDKENDLNPTFRNFFFFFCFSGPFFLVVTEIGKVLIKGSSTYKLFPKSLFTLLLYKYV